LKVWCMEDAANDIPVHIISAEPSFRFWQLYRGRTDAC
jgi:hypothetical protein